MHKAKFASVCGIFVCSKIQLGLVANLIDVLNRFPYLSMYASGDESLSPQPNTIHAMMYIFPRQFGMHNVFTAEVDSKETAQPFKDYTLREDEIRAKLSSEADIKIPKRLRGKASRLVQKLQIQHGRCPYKKLLEHYCPACGCPPNQKAILTSKGKPRLATETSDGSAVL
jgi:telomerase reverse transcriptase